MAARLGGRAGLRGLIAICIVALAGILSYNHVFVDLFSPQHGDMVAAQFKTTAQLRVGDPVRVHGVISGRVKSIDLATGARSATVHMKVERSALPLYRNARATVSMRNLLGGNFYIDLDPGTRSTGTLSGPITSAHTGAQVEIEDITGLDAGAARKGLTQLPRGLADAFSDPRQPQRALKALSDASPNVARGVDALRGVERDEDLKRMIRASNSTVRALDVPADGLKAFVQSGADALSTTAADGDDIRAILRATPVTETQAQATFARLVPTLGHANTLVSKLRRSASSVAPSLAALRPPVVDAAALLEDAEPLLRSLPPTSRALATGARNGVPVVQGIAPSLTRLSESILPTLNKKDPETQLTAAQSVGPFFSSWGGAAAQTDNNGHFFRFPASGGEGILSNDLPCRTYITDPSVKQIAACDSLESALQTYLTYNPLGHTPGTDSSKKGKR